MSNPFGRFLTNMFPFTPPGTAVFPGAGAALSPYGVPLEETPMLPNELPPGGFGRWAPAPSKSMVPNEHGRLVPVSEEELKRRAELQPVPADPAKLFERFAVATDDQIASLGPSFPDPVGSPSASAAIGATAGAGSRVPLGDPRSIRVDPRRSLDSFMPAPTAIPPLLPAPVQTAVEREQSAMGSTAAIAPLLAAAYSNDQGVVAQGLNQYANVIQRDAGIQHNQRELQQAQRQAEQAQRRHEQTIALGQFQAAEQTRRAQIKARLDMARANQKAILEAQKHARKVELQTRQDSLKAQRLGLDVTKARQDFYFKALPTVQKYSGLRHDFRELEEAKNEAIAAGWLNEQTGVRGYMNWLVRGLKSGTWDVAFSDVSSADKFKDYVSRVTRSVMPRAFATLDGQGQVTEGERALMMTNYEMTWDQATGKIGIRNAFAMAGVLRGLYDQLENELKTDRSILLGVNDERIRQIVKGIDGRTVTPDELNALARDAGLAK